MPDLNVMEAISDAVLAHLKSKGVSLEGFKHNTPSGTIGNPNLIHGPGGIFGVEGIENTIISTRLMPRGIASVLPAVGTIRTNPLYGYITGFEDNTGDVADGPCDDPETAGPIKSCLQTAQFGRYSFLTKEIDITTVGRQINAGENLDLNVLNPPLLQDLNGITDMGATVPGNPNLRREVEVAFTAVGVSFQNRLNQQVYTGNPANNTGAGGSLEFPGLDILVGTNKVDAITGINCPSLDSDIKDYNYGRVDQESEGTDIVEVLTSVWRTRMRIAEGTNLAPATFAFAMRQSLFWELAAVWPCSYLTFKCAFRDSQGQARVNVSGAEQIALRDRMMQGKFLLIDGNEIPVIIDDAIVEESEADTSLITASCFASDIYLIPLTARGGFATTFWQYQDWRQTALPAAQDGRLGSDFWSDGGRYLWHKKPPLNWCVQWLGLIQPRLVLLTPHLAARVQNVQYCPLQHERDPFPTDPYFADGGQQNRVGPSLFSDWNLP